jgi:hypothetical protein
VTAAEAPADGEAWHRQGVLKPEFSGKVQSSAQWEVLGKKAEMRVDVGDDERA